MKARRNSLLILCVFLALFLSLQITRCAPSRYRAPRHKEAVKPPKPPRPQPPAGFNIAIKIKEWKVLDHRILDYDPKWGYFRFAGRFDYNGELVFKFKSDQFATHYWLVKIPSLKEGTYECRARLFREPTPWPTVKPPKRFSVVLSITNGKVSSHFIKNPHPGWGEFIFSKYKKGILYLRNPFYPGHEWAAHMPRRDGKWTIYPTIITAREET